MTNARKLAVIRVDGDSAIGAGHLSRCVSIATGLAANGWHVDFAMERTSEKIFDIIVSDRNIEPPKLFCVDGDNDRSDLMEHWADGCDVLIIDKYNTNLDYELALRPWAHRVMVLEDVPNRRHDCDFLLDGNPTRGAADYAALVPARCKLLLGSRYIPLRPVVRGPDRGSTGGAAPKKILVCLGGGSFDDACYRQIFEGITNSTFFGGVLVVSDRPVSVDVMKNPKIHFDTFAGFMNIDDMMAGIDLALGGGGVMLWERCVWGVPSMVFTCSENQASQVNYLAQREAIIPMGAIDLLSSSGVTTTIDDLVAHPERLNALTLRAHQECDGLGVERIVSAIEATCNLA